METSSPSKTIRRPEIDGMRAMAAVWVMFDHFGVSDWFGMHYGFLAVRLMLILSAYFAAKQLRLLWATGPQPPRGAVASKLVHYYTSRVVRLGLVSYATILLAVLLNADGARIAWKWHAVFATNEWIAKYGDWPGCLSHFWSLAVQMQFLLALPLVMIAVGRRGLWTILTVGLLAALGHRACVVYGGAGDFFRWMPLSNSLDAFAMGVALAWIERERPAWFKKIQARSVCATALLCLAATHWLRGNAYESGLGILTETGEALALALLFGAMVGGRTFGAVGAVLRWKPLASLGAASLSLYALHPLVQQMTARLFLRPAPADNLVSLPLFQAITVAAALAVASVAYRLLEIPARKISAAVEPRLDRWIASASERKRGRPAFFSRRGLRPAATFALAALLLYAAAAPLRMAPPLLKQGTPAQPIAGEMDDLPDNLLPGPQPEPLIIDDSTDSGVA